MKISYSFGQKPLSNLDELLKEYPVRQFDSPRRSTVPLLAYWMGRTPRHNEFFQSLKISAPESITMAFEYETPVGKGVGKPSCTDLMVCGDNLVVAVEAKYTEPRDKTVAEWLDAPGDERRTKEERRGNREEVLQGWLDLINGATSGSLVIDDVIDVAYQTIHRTASACYPCKHQPNIQRFMVYQHFADGIGEGKTYTDELDGMRKLIPSPGICFVYLGCQLVKQDAFINLVKRWSVGKERYLAKEVKDGLLSDSLFSFCPPEIVFV